MNAQVLCVPVTVLIIRISVLVLKALFMTKGVLCSCSGLSFRRCLWEVGCIMRHSLILCPHLHVGGFEQAEAHLSLKKGLEETPLLAYRTDHMIASICFYSTSRTANPLISFPTKPKKVASWNSVTLEQRSHWQHKLLVALQ